MKGILVKHGSPNERQFWQNKKQLREKMSKSSTLVGFEKAIKCICDPSDLREHLRTQQNDMDFRPDIRNKCSLCGSRPLILWFAVQATWLAGWCSEALKFV